jgi:hypothetical protein
MNSSLEAMRKQAVASGFDNAQAAFLIGMFTAVIDAVKVMNDPGPRCPNCGSDDLFLSTWDEETGVVAPDMGREVRSMSGWFCRNCGERS